MLLLVVVINQEAKRKMMVALPRLQFAMVLLVLLMVRPQVFVGE